MNAPITVGPDAVRDLRGAVQFGRQFSRESVNNTPTSGVTVRGGVAPQVGMYPLKVTGDELTSSSGDAGLYPATLYVPDALGPGEWQEFDCFARAIPGEVLAIGTVGLGRFIDWHVNADAPIGLPVYVVAASAGAAGVGGAACVEWYSIYLHQQSVTVAKGQTVTPRQLIGQIGPHSNGAHLHIAVGDGIPLAAPSNGFPIAGQSVDIVDWIGRTVVGSHAGDPPIHTAHFTAEQLATIEAHFAFPLDESLDWVSGIGSTAHDGWDYYAVDLVLLDEEGEPTDTAIGQPIYAAFSGDDVRTTVEYCQNLGGDFHWVTILRHQYGDCSPCPPSKIVCEQGYLRRYTCTAGGEWVPDGEVGVPCSPPPPPPGPPPPPPGPPKPPFSPTAPTGFNLVSSVCSHSAECVEVSADYTVPSDQPYLYLIVVDATAGDVTVTLPAGEAGFAFAVMKIDVTEHTVRVTAVDDNTINGGASYDLTARWQGAVFEAACDGGGWLVFGGGGGDCDCPEPPVTSVNDQTGNVTLNAGNVGADPAGSAAAAQSAAQSYAAGVASAAQSAANGYTDSAMSSHVGASNPHTQYVLSSSLAAVATSGAYSDLSGRPTLATVATSGAYSDLSGRPTLATVATSGAYSDLSGRPTLATVATSGAYSDLSGRPTLGTAAPLNVASTGNAATGEVVKGNDTRLSDARTPTSHTHAAGDIASGTLALARGGAGADLSATGRACCGRRVQVRP